MREALRSKESMVEIQLLPTEDMRGRGIVLSLLRANNERGFSELSEDEGMILEPVLAKRIMACVEEKSEKMRKGLRVQQYDRWWLVLDDEVLIVPKWVMNKDEQNRIEESVRTCTGWDQWSKIILISRFQTVETQKKQPKWFWPLWENPRHAPLPGSPA